VPDHHAVAADVRALVADLLPVLAPHALLDGETGLLVLPVASAHARVALDGLVAACAELPQHAWPRTVQAWLVTTASQVSAALTERAALGEVEVEDLLRVQVTPRLPAGQRRELMCTPYGELLDAVIMLDQPDGRRLTRARAELLAVADPGARAVANTLGRELPSFEVTERLLTPDGRLLAGARAAGARAAGARLDEPHPGEPHPGEHRSGEPRRGRLSHDPVLVISKEGSPYVTSALLELGRFLPAGCRYGALVGLPRYSTVLVYPISTRRVRAAAPALAALVRRTYAAGPDRCDQRVYWWVEQRLFEVGLGRSGRLRAPRPLRRLSRALPRG
jgi:hypothetical protein